MEEEQKISEPTLEGRSILNDKYKVIKKFGNGAFGDLY